MSLHASIEMLTRAHKTAAQTVDGVEFHERPALLEQLREAVFGGMESTGGSSMKAKLPISEGALDLYQLIDHQIAEAWAQVRDIPPSTDRPESLAAQWSALVDPDVVITVTQPEQHERWDDDMNRWVRFVVHTRSEYTAENLAARWVQQIEEFFDPPRPVPIEAPCSACGERHVMRRKDGEAVQSSALVFLRDRRTGETLRAECQRCGSMWGPDRFEWLAKTIGIDVDARRADHLSAVAMSDAGETIEI